MVIFELHAKLIPQRGEEYTTWAESDDEWFCVKIMSFT